MVAETGADMTRFPAAQHLGSWAGTRPLQQRLSRQGQSRPTRPGDPYLQGALGTAAMSISHPAIPIWPPCSTDRRSPWPAASRRHPITSTAGRNLEHRHNQHRRITINTAYNDPGADYFTRLNPQKVRNYAIRQL